MVSLVMKDYWEESIPISFDTYGRYKKDSEKSYCPVTKSKEDILIETDDFEQDMTSDLHVTTDDLCSLSELSERTRSRRSDERVNYVTSCKTRNRSWRNFRGWSCTLLRKNLFLSDDGSGTDDLLTDDDECLERGLDWSRVRQVTGSISYPRELNESMINFAFCFCHSNNVRSIPTETWLLKTTESGTWWTLRDSDFWSRFKISWSVWN